MPDPDLEIRGGGGGVGRNRSQKQFFSAVRASVWSKNRGGMRMPKDRGPVALKTLLVVNSFKLH